MRSVVSVWHRDAQINIWEWHRRMVRIGWCNDARSIAFMQRWNVGFVIREWVKGVSAVHSETATINRVCVRERLWATQVNVEEGDASQRAARRHGAWVVVCEHGEVGHSDAWVGFRFRVVVREDGAIRSNLWASLGIMLGVFVGRRQGAWCTSGRDLRGCVIGCEDAAAVSCTQHTTINQRMSCL